MKTFVETEAEKSSQSKDAVRQFSTFYIDGQWFGIDVMQVQEVTKPLPVTAMRAAPPFIRGLINLRGQIATAIGLREFFGLKSLDSTDRMTVVCRVDDVLLSLQVDQIGDVIEVSQSQFEHCPATVRQSVRAFMAGVYKMEGQILSILCLQSVVKELDKRCAA